jgi:hypothetical protein
VAKEWKTALEVHGLEAIFPAALEPPDRAPPPKALQKLQFGSVADALAELRARQKKKKKKKK